MLRRRQRLGHGQQRVRLRRTLGGLLRRHLHGPGRKTRAMVLATSFEATRTAGPMRLFEPTLTSSRHRFSLYPLPVPVGARHRFGRGSCPLVLLHSLHRNDDVGDPGLRDRRRVCADHRGRRGSTSGGLQFSRPFRFSDAVRTISISNFLLSGGNLNDTKASRVKYVSDISADILDCVRKMGCQPILFLWVPGYQRGISMVLPGMNCCPN